MNEYNTLFDGEQNAFVRELRYQMADFLKENQFALVSQPIFDFAAKRICGYEILSRLDHPEHGEVSPSVFLPVINDLQLHAEFDCLIFTESCRWMSHLRKSGKSLEWLSCNFSRKTLEKAGIVEKLVKITDSFGIPHNCMGIELTEYVNADNAKQFQENIRGLKEHGFLILVDDMGSGVTSSDDLLNIPVDIVKIDRSVLMAASSEEGAQHFRRLVQLIHALGKKSLCEGVEKYNELQFIQEAGCSYGQGFLFMPPADTDSVEAMMPRRPR